MHRVCSMCQARNIFDTISISLFYGCLFLKQMSLANLQIGGTVTKVATLPKRRTKFAFVYCFWQGPQHLSIRNLRASIDFQNLECGQTHNQFTLEDSGLKTPQFHTFHYYFDQICFCLNLTTSNVGTNRWDTLYMPVTRFTQ